jgi:signal transduction histidine kinase/ActR/RegA family two-component response regulator
VADGDASAVEPQRALEDAREQLAATSEILTALGRSGSDPEAVLGTIVDSARQLCHADQAQIYLVDGDRYRLARSSGLSDEVRAFIDQHPLVLDRASLVGRVGLDRRTQQIEDVLADLEYGRSDWQRIAGFRTTVGAPMLLDDDVGGVLLLWRSTVAPFDAQSLAVLTTFAAQAAIAVRQVQLVRELETRGAELVRRVAELEALNEVGDAVSSSLELDEVLATVVATAVQLSGTEGGSLFEYDEDSHLFALRTAYGTEPELVERLRRTRIGLDGTLVGRAAAEARPVQVPDLDAVELDAHQGALHAFGWRSVLVVPLLREAMVVGALVVRRRSTGGFDRELCEVLETFASQSALAILNARLFGELGAQRAQLEMVSQHKSDFLASMSHELRTPLNAVIGFSEVLLDRMAGDLNDQQDEYLRDIHDAGRHLLELLNEVLDLSKVEAGQMELDATPFAVDEVLRAGMALVRERASRHGIRLQLHVDADVGSLVGDELRFKQVVLNLLSNAVKFTPDGGQVSAAAHRVADRLEVTVTDTGPGIAADDQQRIFESFQQGGRGIRREEGTGLGLTLSRRLVGLMGGELWLDSEPGRGSTFGFSVPVEPGADENESVTSQPADRSQPLVALVEDDPLAADLLTLHLKGAGFDVVSARDGTTGIGLVRRLSPDAVVLDIRLPGLDGWEVMSRLAADPSTAETPVVVVSVVDERPRGMASGAAAYLVKPVSRDDLIEALARAGVPAAAAR